MIVPDRNLESASLEGELVEVLPVFVQTVYDVEIRRFIGQLRAENRRNISFSVLNERALRVHIDLHFVERTWNLRSVENLRRVDVRQR